jgi:hypothetical protein
MVVTTKDHTSDLAHSNNKGTYLVNTSYVSRLIHQVASIIERELRPLPAGFPDIYMQFNHTSFRKRKIT